MTSDKIKTDPFPPPVAVPQVGFRPLYRQVKDEFVKRMVDGLWPAGLLLPSEGQLAAEIGVSQGTEILAAPGVALAGLLPDSLQLWTSYEAAAATGSDPRAQPFLALFASDAGRAAFAAIGFTP